MGETVSSLQKSIHSIKFKDTKAEDTVAKKWHYEYSTIVGYFKQDAAETSSNDFDAMKENFGLIEQEYDTDKQLPANGKDLTQWQRFAHKLETMNRRAPDEVSYRLLYLGRHGQGYHNVAALFYGDNAWDCYYSTLNQDPHIPTITFFDAHLTAVGKHQAHTARRFWHHQLTTHHTPPPQTHYVSPHARALQTAHLTFSPLLSSPSVPSFSFRPLVKELLREGHGIHTCDSRPTKSHILATFPSPPFHFRIEDGFSETDELYSPVLREPPRAHTRRLRALLDDVLANDESTYISMTSHHGTIGATLAAVGHRPVVVRTGGVVPVLVKVVRVPGPRAGGDRYGDGEAEDRKDWETKPACVGDPLTARRSGYERYRDIAEFLAEIEAEVPVEDR